ncbi:DUF4175 domain-containing protein [Swaminathania salitolerans]|nr:DUF4175 family protein [Swaminathania salitolerans]GBQ16046.1 hypothetical protein AA21291_2391 [Swaminathania salitolerans LMG 21291]
MATPAPDPNAGTLLADRIRRARERARRVLRAEAAWPVLQWPLALLGGYALTGLFRIPQSLPDTLHAFLLAGTGGGAIALMARGLSRLPPIPLSRIDRRIETRSGLRHQPLATLEDHPSDGRENGLWQIHLDRIRAGIGPLRSGWPRPVWSRARLCGWAAFSACFALGLVLAGPAAPSRLEAAFLPGVDDIDVPMPHIEAWIDMPDYAPGAPVFLADRGTPSPLPQGAKLSVHVTGARSAPHFLGNDTGTIAARQLDPGSWTFTAPLEQSGLLSVRSRGRTIGEWRFEIVPDRPPEVAWTAPPHREENGDDTVLPWKTAQAHGVSRLEAIVTPVSKPDRPALVLDIPLKGAPLKAEGSFSADLTESLWAGETVSIRLRATSHSGKTASSDAKTLRLPERVFHDPVARALIGVRRRFGLGLETPARTADEMRTLAQAVSERDKGVMLALFYMAAQLDDPLADHDPGAVLGLSWATALFLDEAQDSGRETAQANLEIRAAQKAVQAQIDHMRSLGAKGHGEAEQEELAHRMKTLHDALNRRMQALMLRSMQLGTIIPDTGGATGDGSDPVSRLMRRLQSDAANGRGSDALKRLDELGKMARRMRMATPQDLARIAQQMQARARAQAQRATLHDLVHRETVLLDHVQSRLGARSRAAQENERNETGQDVASMSTAELLRRLGMTPPPDMAKEETPPAPAPLAPESPEDVGPNHAQRRDDHASQRALQMVARFLNEDIKSLTGKSMAGLGKADTDMRAARHALAQADDPPAEAAIRRVLKDLAETGKEMSEAQKGEKHGGGPIAMLPVMGSPGHAHGGKGKGQSSEGENEDDESEGSGAHHEDRDPLGRKLGKGHSGADTDGTVPDADSREKARAIERELRRRDADRTRPQTELDYLDRLLKSY